MARYLEFTRVSDLGLLCMSKPSKSTYIHDHPRETTERKDGELADRVVSKSKHRLFGFFL